LKDIIMALEDDTKPDPSLRAAFGGIAGLSFGMGGGFNNLRVFTAMTTPETSHTPASQHVATASHTPPAPKVETHQVASAHVKPKNTNTLG
jgi:hypothetical protein